MSTAILPPLVPSQLHSWADYQHALDVRKQEGRIYRITFDGERLEIMTISSEHGCEDELLAQLVNAFLEELGISAIRYGNMTLKRISVNRGLEADRTYYIRNYSRMRGRKHIDLDTDPSPDLAIEVEISRTALDRMSIYAALGVPEVWRFDGESLIICVLRQGSYVASLRSEVLPIFPVGECLAHLARWPTMDDVAWISAWRQWLRTNVVPQAS